MAGECGVCGCTLSRPLVPARQASPVARYFRCRRCRSIFLSPLPRQETNEAFEGDEAGVKYLESDALREGYFADRLRLVEAMSTGRRGRLLDIGCSTGQLMRLARRAGWQVEGVEMSAALAREARAANPGCTIHQTDFLRADSLAPGSFDAIVSLDVLEHVLSPGEMTRRIATLLQPGGILLLQTPNADSLRARLHGARWNMLIPEYHFHLLSPRAMKTLLADNGFGGFRVHTASGTGRERGLSASLAIVKNRILSAMQLGNALLAAARKLDR